MKAFVCELCGSNDIAKRGDEFVCEACGTKYGVEEARRMMVEGKVDVSGSQVKLDNSDRIKNLYDVARRARDQDNAEQAAHYYGQIVTELPNDWEAAFFSVYYQSMQTNIAGIAGAANRITNCLDHTVTLIKEHVTDQADILTALSAICMSTTKICYMLAVSAKNHYDGIGDSIREQHKPECANRITAATVCLLTLGDCIYAHFPDDHSNKLFLTAWKAGMDLIYQYMNFYNKDQLTDVLMDHTLKVHPYDPDFAKKYLLLRRDCLEDQKSSIESNRRSEKLSCMGCLWVLLAIACPAIPFLIDHNPTPFFVASACFIAAAAISAARTKKNFSDPELLKKIEEECAPLQKQINEIDALLNQNNE